jgi:hypothetical protein
VRVTGEEEDLAVVGKFAEEVEHPAPPTWVPVDQNLVEEKGEGLFPFVQVIYDREAKREVNLFTRAGGER